MDYNILKKQIKDKAIELGFLEAKISRPIISQESADKFNAWISAQKHGDMYYLNNNQQLRFNPQQLAPQTLSIISVKMPYLQDDISFHRQRQLDNNHAYISCYAIGRDYHKVVKQKLRELTQWINNILEQEQADFRVFTDSAPIMEVQLATQAGLGWRGKNTLLINKNHGSLFFLGEIFTTLPLPTDEETTSHCGSCQKCLTICPTQAFDSEYQLDARKCISYLTIENHGEIPLEFRRLIGNRIYGCDDCQLICPWNKFAKLSSNIDFKERNNLNSSSLLELFLWNEEDFKSKMQGSPIFRIGYERWQRNLAVGLGNTSYSIEIVNALTLRKDKSSPLVAEHIQWAIDEQILKRNQAI